MPFTQKLGGNNKKLGINTNDSLGKNCLSSNQTEYIYKKVELGNLINKNTMKEEIDPDIELAEPQGPSMLALQYHFFIHDVDKH